MSTPRGRWPLLFAPATVVALLVVLSVMPHAPRPAPWYAGIHDLTGIMPSPDLAPALGAAVAALDAPQPRNRVTADLEIFDDLLVRVRPLATRQAAGDETYARWQAEPTNPLWLELALNYDYLLHRRGDQDRMYARPELADQDTPFGAYAAGRRRFRHGDRGELLRRAETMSAGLDSLTRTWLTIKLAEADHEGGDPVAGARRLVAWLPAARRLGGARLEGRIWKSLSRILRDDDRLDDALLAATMEAACFRRVGCAYMVLDAQTRIAGIMEHRLEMDGALALAQRVADEAEADGFDWYVQVGLDMAAAILDERGEYRGALALDLRNLDRARAVADPLNTPHSLASVAHDHLMLGSVDSCYAYLMAAKIWVDAHPDDRNVARMNNQLVEFYCHVGRYAAADSLLAVAGDQSGDAGTARDEALLLTELLPQAIDAGRADLAYAWLARLDKLAGALFDRGLDQNLRADYQLAKLRLLARQGEFGRAAAALAGATAAVTADGGEGKQWALQAAAGELALLRGDLPTAEAAYRRGLDLAAAGTDPDRLARSRFQLGRVLLAEGEAGDARDLFRPVDTDTTFGGRFGRRLESRLLLGESFLAEGRPEEALDHFRRALALCGPYTPADRVARCELETGRALAASGRADEAGAHLEKAAAALVRAPGIRTFEEVAAYLSDTDREIREARVGLAVDHPGLGGKQAVGPATLRIARPDAAALSPPRDGAPRLVFFVGAGRSFAWVVGADGVTLHPLPAADELRAALAPVLADLSVPGRPVDDAALAAVSRLLLGAVAPRWRAGEVLTVLPDGPLYGVPWSALAWPGDPDGSRLVVDHGPVVEAVTGGGHAAPAHAGSPADLRILAAGCDSDLAAGGGDPAGPRLHLAEAEARDVAALWPPAQAEVRLGGRAAWDSLRAAGPGRFGVIHIATHASVHQGLPGRSTLRLAAGSDAVPVTLRDVAGLHLGADLVYLSCCDAAVRAGGRGGALTDFAGAFLAAGAHAVVASSLWVDDAAAHALALEFYRNWWSEGDAAKALWAARRELRAAHPQWSHPAYWAFTRLLTAP